MHQAGLRDQSNSDIFWLRKCDAGSITVRGTLFSLVGLLNLIRLLLIVNIYNLLLISVPVSDKKIFPNTIIPRPGSR